MSVPIRRVQAAHGPWSWLARACAVVAVLGVVAVGSAAQAQANLALNRPVVTSSAEPGLTGNFAVDGNAGTRWGSGFTANEWLYVDLGTSQAISRVVLTWETAYGRGYTIQTSNDATNWQNVRVITDGDGGTDDLAVTGTGRYVRVLGQVRGAIDYGYSLWELAIYGATAPTGDLARGRPATASTVEANAAHLAAQYAFDGDATTRWSSESLEAQWIRVDLGSSQQLGRVVLNWEGAYGKQYALEGSTDGTTWTALAPTITDGAPGSRAITVSGTARYVRMRGIERGTGYGYSLWSFEVYAPGGGPQDPPPQTTNQTVKLMFPELAYAKINVSPAPISVTPTPEEGNTTPSVRNPPGPFTYELTFPPNTTVTMSKNQFSPTQPNTDIRLAVTTSTGTVLRGQTVSALAVQGAEWKVEIYSTGGPTDPRDRTIIPDPYVAPPPPPVAGAFPVIAPANGAMITTTRRPTLQWSAATGATNYQVYVNVSRNDYDWMAPGSLLDRYTLMATVTGTSWTLTEDLPDRWTYKWYVVATFPSGNTSRSDLRTFSVYLPVVETAADGVNLINGARDLNKNGTLEPYEDWRNPISVRVNDLMGRMTREEKALQMFFDAKTVPAAGFTMGPLSPQDIVDFQRASAATRLGIPHVDAGDTIHGYKTSWPTQPALAASRDLDTVYELGDMQRREQLAIGSRGTLSPLAEVGTKVLYPRIQEGGGEDADLAAGMTRALVAGLQGGPEVNPHSIWVTTKHWPGQGAGGEAGITYDGTTIHYHMRPWHAAIEAGTSGIMPGYAGSWLLGPEGYGAGDNPSIINYLRQKLGYNGVVCSDWLPSGAWVRSATAGSDVMGGATPTQWADFATAVSETRINEATRRILDLKFRLGVFEDPYRRGPAGTSEWHTADHKALARRAAQGAMTLLKNDGALPLRLSAGASIVVAGPRADDTACMVTWRSDFHGTEFGDLTIYQAIKQRAEAAGITVYKDNAPAGVTPNAAIVVVGESYFTHGTEWDKEKPYLPGDPIGPAHDAKWGNQYGIITGFKSRNIPTTTVLILPRPYILTNVVPQTNALLVAYRPGDMGGLAVADVLFGDVLPRGMLPWQLPRGMDQIGTDVEAGQIERWDYPFDLGATTAQRAEIRARIAAGQPILPIYGNPLFQYGAGIQGFGLVDATPPTAFTLLTPAPGSTITTKPSFTWSASSDPQTGIHRYEVFVDGSPFPVATTRTTSATLNTAIGNGAHTWFVRAYNWAGGVTTSATATFTLNDTTPPATFAALLPAAGTTVPGATTTFTWEQTTDVGAGVSRYILVLDGTERSPTVTPRAYVGLTTNLSLGRNAVATSNEFGTAGDAVDGSMATRWSSRNDVANPDTESITVDLGAVHSIKRVVLKWEAAYGRQYVVETSVDGATGWQTLRSVTTGDGGEDVLDGLSGVGRYVRMRGVQRQTTYGYSLWEFEVYGVGTEQLSVTGLNAGSHTWRVRAVDGANNSTLSTGPITFTK
ncbi:galactose-binding domain-containing protein [Pyxidicoccus xibeiensis]|uniref:galactose-binding domain-containing protein n=1 Tax=Pyxidicoccus xibeiensis TaxID=2906759 RepID=UPI0020A78ECC|nr:discoidin domain-containing protein [Pyxidicoccus xibeiensis]MCP3140043.1 discoidin domain-containing protein [Pyxidicoccus xibeiensis]